MKTSLQTLIFVIFSCSLFGQSTFDNLFLRALADEKFEDASYWLGKGANINVIDTSGLSSLHDAARNDNRVLAEWLIQKGANINVSEIYGATPMMYAANNGNLRMCYLLYSKGADLKQININGRDAKYFAENAGYLRVAKFLVNPQSYSENPTFIEYYQYSINSINVKDTLNALKYADLAFHSGEVELLQSTEQFGNFINYVALIYHELGQFEKAEPLLLKALKLNERFNGKESSTYIDLLAVVAYNYQNMKKYAEAEICFTEILSAQKKISGEKHPDYFSALSNLAYCYLLQDKYNQAEPLFLQIQLRHIETEETQNSNYVSILNILGQIKLLKGNYVEAEQLYEQVLKIQKELTGIYNTDYASYSNNLAQVYIKHHKYEQAEDLLLLTLEIQYKILKENHPDFIETLSSLAEIYVQKDQFIRAELLYNQVLSIQREYSLENSISSAITLNGLATLYERNGQWDKPEELYLRSLQIAKEVERGNAQNYSSILNNLAGFYVEVGKSEKAEEIYLEAIELTKSKLGKFHPDYIDLLHSLGLYYKNMMLFDKAISNCGLALLYTSQFQGQENLDYLRYSNSMASICLDTYNFELADTILNSTIQICKKLNLDTRNPLYVNTVELQATLYSNQSKYDKAEKLYKQLIEIRIGISGEKTIEIASLFQKLGVLYSNQGKFELAEPFYKKAIEIKKEIEGESHPDYINLLNSFGMACHETRKYDLAEKYYLEAFMRLTHQIKLSFSYLTSIDRENFWEGNKAIFNVYNIFVKDYYSRNPNISKFAYNNELFIKGLLLNTSLDIQNKILNSNDSIIIYAWVDLRRINAQILSSERKQEDILKLIHEADSIDKILTQKVQVYQLAQSKQLLQWQDIQNKLKDGEAAIEFFSFRYFHKDWTDSTLYCALVLRKQDTIPHMVYLFEEKQLAEALPKQDNNSDADINNTYAVLRGGQLLPDSSLYQSENLYNLVWKPLDSLLLGVKTISFACSGLLNTVSFAAISDTSGKLLCEKYALNQYCSTRNLVIETEELPITDATIYGGIQYELDTTLMIANAKQYSKSKDFALAYNFTRSDNKRVNGFDELEGTREEANAIITLFKEKKITTNNYTGAAANEESFKAMAEKKSPSVIHLSTHGFYYPETTTPRKSAPELQLAGSDLNRFQYSPDPLIRSGIVLAGANRAWRGEPVPDGVEDGILTAKDVSQLNLNNTQLVVLSACQTGLGDVKGSEGVFGLQRAFKMAGVRYLMMSLWSVPDKETKEFMEMFYTHWLSGIPIRSAFQTTQQEMRLEYPTEPYKWAAFVLVE